MKGANKEQVGQVAADIRKLENLNPIKEQELSILMNLSEENREDHGEVRGPNMPLIDKNKKSLPT